MIARGLMFHHFEGGDHRRVQGSLRAAAFERLLDALGPGRVLPAGEWADRARRGALRDDQLCITFDDSLRSPYDLALPLLEARGLTAFWFVYTSVVDGGMERLEIYRQFRNRCFESVEAFYAGFFRALESGAHRDRVDSALARFDPDSYMADYSFYTPNDRRFRFVRDDVLGPERYRAVMEEMMAAHEVTADELAAGLWLGPDQVSDLHRRGHLVGLHSHTHPTRLAELPASDQEREYGTNAARLEEITGERPVTMSHPSNSYGPETLRILRSLGVELGFCTGTDPAPTLLEMPREDSALLCRRIGLALESPG